MKKYVIFWCAGNTSVQFDHAYEVRLYIWEKDLSRMAIFKDGFIIPFGYSSYSGDEFQRTLEIFRPEAMR